MRFSFASSRALAPAAALSLLLLAACGPEHPRPATDPDPAPVDTVPDRPPPSEPTDRFSVLYDDDAHGLFAFSRPFGEDLLVIVTNWSDEAHGLRIPKPAPGHYERAQATTDGPYRVQTDETGIILEIDARTTLVLRRVEVPMEDR